MTSSASSHLYFLHHNTAKHPVLLSPTIKPTPITPYTPSTTSLPSTFTHHTMAAETPDPTQLQQQAQNAPNPDRLKEAASAAENAIAAQGIANKLRETASSFTDPKKREKMLTDAYNKEMEAHGSSKKARMLQSGAFQGSVGGAGIGGAVSAGVGTLVGTVVGGVTAIPMTGLGALTGAGVGVIYGPFIKLGNLAKGGGKGEGKEGEKKDGEGEKEEEIDPEDEDVVPNPEALRQAADALAEERAKKGLDPEPEGKKGGGENAGRKKPRKIEIRSGQK